MMQHPAGGPYGHPPGPYPPMMPPPGGGPFPYPPGPFPGPSGLLPPPPLPPPLLGAQTQSWAEFKTPEGRPYYYNKVTKQTCWDKPDEMKCEADRLLEACPWKEFKTEDGKVYYHNVLTKSSAWTMPDELRQIKDRIANGQTAPNQHSLNVLSTSESRPKLSSTPPMPKESQKKASPEDIHEPGQIVDEDSNSNLPDSVPEIPEEKPLTKAEYFEKFKKLLREKGISSGESWEKTIRAMANEPRFEMFRTHPDRKIFFNEYRMIRAKEEKAEQKERVIWAKKEMRRIINQSDRLNDALRYREATEIWRTHDFWKIIPDPERQELLAEIVEEYTKKKYKREKEAQERNMAALSEILDAMPQITYRTTWQEAQQMLLDCPDFAENAELLAMEKEHALMAFETHIRQLEEEDLMEKNRERKIKQRNYRINRENFLTFLDELHASGKLNSLSKWCTLYHEISADARFDAMLNQALSGSTPLDLFKFYVEDLKARFQDEKIVIKDILKRQDFQMTPTTEFSEFVTVLSRDPRSAKLDSGNVKLMHEQLLEKERERFKEKRKEEAKARRRLEAHFLELLEKIQPEITEHSKWSEVRPQICNEEAFHAIPTEEERIEIFESALESLVESCSHHHNHKSSHHRHRCHANPSSSSSSKPKKDKKHSSSSRKESSGHKSSSRSSSKHRHRTPQSSSRSRSRSSSLSLSDSSSSSSASRSFSPSPPSHARESKDHRDSRYTSSGRDHDYKSSSRRARTPSRSPSRKRDSSEESYRKSSRRRERSSERDKSTKRPKHSDYDSSRRSRDRDRKSENGGVSGAELEELEKQRKLLLAQLAHHS